MSSLDLKWLICGDFSVDDGDFKSVDNQTAYELQETLSRICASEKDYLYDSNEICANLETFIGREVNNNLTDDVKSRIVHALTYYGYLSATTKIEVRSQIITNNSIGAYLKLMSPSYQDIYINVYLDIATGIISAIVEESGDVRYPQ
jgi:hypothetical protein